MPHIRRLPSGKWYAEVVLPVRLANGRQKRVSKTHPSKTTVRQWATKLEAAVDTGAWTDPRAGEITLRDYHERWVPTRSVAGATESKTDSHWRNHVEPAFGGHPLTAITRPALRRWVKTMTDETCPRCHGTPGLTKAGYLVRHDTAKGLRCNGSGQPPGLGAWTVQGAASTLAAILSAAVEDGLLGGNPAHGLRLPQAPSKPVFFWTRDQATRLVDALDGDGLMCNLDLHVGLRWGELAGLRRRFVDVDHQLIHVRGVQTRNGWRDYPKSAMSRRTVPIPPKLRDQLAEHVEPLGPDDYVFPAPGGGPWDDTNFRRRVFTPAVADAGVPSGTPHDMRHTAASWLVQAGVDLYRVQALLGHESFRTTQRYAHLAPDAFDRIVEAWS